LKRKIARSTLVLFIAAVLVGVAIAAVMCSYQITPVTMRVKADYTISIYEEDHTTAVVSHDWSDFDVNDMKYWVIHVDNDGNIEAKVTWKTTGFPSGWTLLLYLWNGAVETSQWLENTEQKSIPVDSSLQARFKLKLTDPMIPGGTNFSFDITFDNNNP